MKIILNWISILFFCLAINSVSSCKKTKPIPSPSPKEITPKSVTGKWRWIYSYINGPLGPNNPLTPANTATTEGLEYTSKQTWKKLFNNSAIDSGTFTLGHDTYINPSNAKFNFDQILYNRNNAYLGVDYYDVLGDTLILDPSLRDYFTSLNVRNIGGTKWFVKD